jgi:hypothetical protein
MRRPFGSETIRSSTACTGFEGLEDIDSLELVRNGIVETSGLANLRQVGELALLDNPRLVSLHGLNGISRARSVQIRNNPLLCPELGFLPALSQVSEALDLGSNAGVSKRDVDHLLQRVKLANLEWHSAGRELAQH